MKKQNLFLVAVFSLFFFTVHAQFRAGLSACGVLSDVQGADFIDFDNDFYKVGFAAGGIMNSYIDDQNSFQFELNYITKGSMQRPDSLNQHYYKLVLNYIEVPLVYRHQLKFVLNKKPRNNFEIEFGASVGRVVKYKQLLNNYSQPFNDDQFNHTDVSLLLGFNYHINNHLYAGLRYSNSVIPALKRNNIPYGFYRVAFNNGNNMVFQLGLHYVFGNPQKTVSDDSGVSSGQ